MIDTSMVSLIDSPENEKKLSNSSIKLIDEFFEFNRKLGKSDSLIRNYRYDIMHFVNSCNIENIENTIVEDIEDYIAILRERKCSGATINRRLCALKTLFRFLRRKYHRTLRREKRNHNNPDLLDQIRSLIEEYDDILNLESVQSIKKEKLPFNMEEIAAMLSEIKKPENNRYSMEGIRNYLIIKLSAVGTGARNTAIRQLLIKDLSCSKCDGNCDKCIPTINIQRKGKKEFNRTKVRVKIEKETCKELRNYLKMLNFADVNQPVFLSRKKNFLSIAQMNRILQKAMELANIDPKGRTFHSLRHTFITECIKNGTPWGHMMIQVDHKAKLGITAKYEHLQPEDLIIKFPKLP
ncbi:MAG: tyrosine-type recombinase/integrase [Candidatus Helarchaeota archaeon]